MRLFLLFLLSSALEIEKYRKHLIRSQTGNSSAQETVDEILKQDFTKNNSNSMLDSAWHGVEATHLYIMLQKLIYGGNIEKSLHLVRLPFF